METEMDGNPVSPAEPRGLPPKSKPVAGIIRYTSMFVLGIAASALFVMMFLIATDVLSRFFFNKPVPGAYELTEYLMAVVVPLGIAYCAQRKQHVGVDIIVEKFSVKNQKRVAIVTESVTVLLMGIVVWQNWVNFFEIINFGGESAVLHIPSYPFVLALPVGFMAFMLFSIAHLIEDLREVFGK
ncbi:MAG: TRAP transporter small permease [Pseudomonadota bacterium]